MLQLVCKLGLKPPQMKLPPQVMSKHNSSWLRVVAVALAAALLVGGAVAGALGVGLDTSVGTTCGEACVKLSCAPLQWWTCAPSPTYWYNGCGFGQSSAGEGFIQCPTVSF